MSPLSGYSTALPNEILLNPAILTIGSAIIGVTKGGVSWDPEMTVTDVAFDGKRSKNIKGLDRVSMRGGKLSGNLLQIASTAQQLRLEPGAATATGGTGVTSIVTPKGAGILFASGDYVTDLRAIWETGQGSGHYFAIHLACALCVKYGIKGADGAEADVSFDFQACLDLSTQQIGDAAFTYENRTALP